MSSKETKFTAQDVVDTFYLSAGDYMPRGEHLTRDLQTAESLLNIHGDDILNKITLAFRHMPAMKMRNPIKWISSLLPGRMDWVLQAGLDYENKAK